jgi:FxsC-like protein
MGRDFFFSYSSLDLKQGKKDDLYRFFKDLQDKLQEFGRGDGGFFAGRTIETGEDWKDELVENLKSCHVLVSLYSPNYFKSPHCGREWQVYYDRFQENKVKPPPDVVKPEVILPVLWTAELLDIPKEVTEIQDKSKTDYPDVYQTYGLSYLMRSSARSKYEDFVHKFGRRLAEMLRAQGDPKVRPVQDYDEIDPVFPPGSKRGLTLVRYVFFAGLKGEMQTHRQKWDGYGIYVNRKDWRPCHPDENREAGEIASSLAAAAGKTFEFIEPGEKLKDRLKAATELENIVVIVVDPWSMSIPTLRTLAGWIDTEPLPNSALVVMWNEKGEPAAGMPLLQAPGPARFETREGRKEYVSSVRSYEEFRQTVESFFNVLREKMMTDGKIRSAETGSAEPPPPPVLLQG